MLWQQGPAQTFSYMVLGFAVILGFMAAFVISLAIRFRNLRRDRQALEDLEAKGQA